MPAQKGSKLLGSTHQADLKNFYLKYGKEYSVKEPISRAESDYAASIMPRQDRTKKAK